MVRELEVTPYPSARGEIIKVLQRVSETLESLRFVETTDYHDLYHYKHNYGDTLEERLIRSDPKLYFPALRHIFLGDGVFRQIDIFIFFLLEAPNLLSLGISISPFSEEDPLDFPYQHHRIIKNTKLERLLIQFDDNTGMRNWTETVCNLLLHSPQLLQLSFRYRSENPGSTARLTDHIRSLPNLSDVIWHDKDLDAFRVGRGVAVPAVQLFRGLRRLMLSSSDFRSPVNLNARS